MILSSRKIKPRGDRRKITIRYVIDSERKENPGNVHKCEKYLGALVTDASNDDKIVKALKELSNLVLEETGQRVKITAELH